MFESRTLGEIAREANATFFSVSCLNHRLEHCWHDAKFSLVHAIALWGPSQRLSRLRFVCSRCGSRNFDFTFRHPVNQGGTPLWPALDYHASLYGYRWRHLWRHDYDTPSQNYIRLSPMLRVR